MPKNRQTGQCKLTGDTDRLVKAHIIPKALTKRDRQDRPFAQSGGGKAPIKRWDSWYDDSIVTAKGEEILASIDEAGIKELRRLKLVWSSWEQRESLGVEEFETIPDIPQWGIRTFHDVDGNCLRLFFLSLLWRAAVSDMAEFQEVRLRASELRRLRRMLIEKDPTPLHRFPIALIQLSTRGSIHNLTPLKQRKPRNPLNPNGPSFPIIRLYFDGLMAHIHTESTREEVGQLGSMFVGAGKELYVSTVTYEASWQRENLEELIAEAEGQWPDRVSRIMRT